MSVKAMRGPCCRPEPAPVPWRYRHRANALRKQQRATLRSPFAAGSPTCLRSSFAQTLMPVTRTLVYFWRWPIVLWYPLRRLYFTVRTLGPLAGPSTSAVTVAPATIGAPIRGSPSPPTSNTRSNVTVLSSGPTSRSILDQVAARHLMLAATVFNDCVHVSFYSSAEKHSILAGWIQFVKRFEPVEIDPSWTDNPQGDSRVEVVTCRFCKHPRNRRPLPLLRRAAMSTASCGCRCR